MTTAPPPDPFEEQWAEIVLNNQDMFTSTPFGYIDPELIEEEVAKFRAYLDETPSAER
jgi:hypothetical protein